MEYMLAGAVVVNMAVSVFKLSFKVGYYQARLERAGIEDAVKDLSFWQMVRFVRRVK
jgi:hypothetical protein